MKHIAFRLSAGNSARAKRTVSRARAVFCVQSAFLIVASAAASTVPHFGGTLRIEVSGRIDAIDPRLWPTAPAEAALAERLNSLVFDRLVRLDEHGTPQPALAISWQHDAQSKRWEFRLRQGVKFSDGTTLTPSIAAMALQQLLGITFDVSANSDSVVILADQSSPNLADKLATGRYFVFHAEDNGSLFGTGPFTEGIREAEGRNESISFIANGSCWAGRPFVDKIDLAMNVDIEQQANAIAFGQADVVELPASQVRRSTQRGVRTVSTEPIELFALVFDGVRPTMQDARVRQAISLAIDRSSIADVILQRQGLVAGDLLPNWISGYAHLFPVSFDVPRAKDLLAASGHALLRSTPLVLFYDSGDAEARAVADRVAVNLREIGIIIQVSGHPADGKTKPTVADLRLVRHHLTGPDPGTSLSELLNSLGETATEMASPEQIYAAERAPIAAFRVIPLVHVTESYGLSPQVRDWMAPRWGGWDLADVWLGGPPSTVGNTP
jgi:peptide/nickel transport system substrate-binding protein